MKAQTEMNRQRIIGIIRKGEAGDIFLCREDENNGKDWLVWKIYDRRIVRYLISCQKRVPWERCAAQGTELFLYFPYVVRRPLLEFLFLCQDREELCMELLAICMSGRIPTALLLLLLESEALNLRQDGSLYMTYELELERLDPEATEAACVQECAQWILFLLKQENEYERYRFKTGENLKQFREKKRRKRRIQLIEKKLERGWYETFLELYRDFRWKETGHTGWSLALPKDNRLFYILFTLGVLLSSLALIVGAWFLLTGELPLFRLFDGPLEKIGTIWMSEGYIN